MSTSGIRVIGSRLKYTWPPLGRVLPLITSHSVVLPAPFGPITTRRSLKWTPNSTTSSARKPSNETTTSFRYTMWLSTLSQSTGSALVMMLCIAETSLADGGDGDGDVVRLVVAHAARRLQQSVSDARGG